MLQVVLFQNEEQWCYLQKNPGQNPTEDLKKKKTLQFIAFCISFSIDSILIFTSQ